MENEETIIQNQQEQELNNGNDSNDSNNNKKFITLKKDLLELNQVSKTRKLYVKGTNIQEFVQILKKETKTAILKVFEQEEVSANQDYNHQEQEHRQENIQKGIIRFKNSVSTQFIQKLLRINNLNLHIKVSKSSSKNDKFFFLPSSSSQDSQNQVSNIDLEKESINKSTINDKLNVPQDNLVIDNSTNINKLNLSNERLFTKLAELLIDNPNWGFTGLMNYIKSSMHEEDRSQSIGIICERLPALENAVRLVSILKQEQVEQQQKQQIQMNQNNNQLQQQQQQNQEQQQQIITIEQQIQGQQENDQLQSQQNDEMYICQIKEEDKNRQEEIIKRQNIENEINDDCNQSINSPMSLLMKQYLEIIKLKEDMKLTGAQRSETLSQLSVLSNFD